MRITTVPLETKFLQQLDRHSTKLVQIIRNKGGVTKERTARILHSLDEVCTITIESDWIKYVWYYLNRSVLWSLWRLYINFFLHVALGATEVKRFLAPVALKLSAQTNLFCSMCDKFRTVQPSMIPIMTLKPWQLNRLCSKLTPSNHNEWDLAYSISF